MALPISEEEKAEIKEGISQADNGETKTTEEVLSKRKEMALKIVWSKRAENGYDKKIQYLEEEWTGR